MVELRSRRRRRSSSVAVQCGVTEGPESISDGVNRFLESGAVVVMEHRHAELGDQPGCVLRVLRVHPTRRDGFSYLLNEQVRVWLCGSRHFSWIEGLEPEMLRCHETRSM